MRRFLCPICEKYEEKPREIYCREHEERQIPL